MSSNRGDIFACKACGAVVEILEATTCTPRCCGEAMVFQAPNTVDAAKEKHVPVVEKSATGGVRAQSYQFRHTRELFSGI